MTILVCGSRSWNDGDVIDDTLRAYPQNTVILHGGARGPDLLAADTACRLGMTVRAFSARWGRYGKSAGIRRNIQMLDERPNLVLAFWDGVSKGTAQTIAEVCKRGIPVRIIGQENIPPRRRLTRSSIGGTS